MREEKEQCKQELQKALERLKARKRIRRAYQRINHPQQQEDRWGCKYHRTLSSASQDLDAKGYACGPHDGTFVGYSLCIINKGTIVTSVVSSIPSSSSTPSVASMPLEVRVIA